MTRIRCGPAHAGSADKQVEMKNFKPYGGHTSKSNLWQEWPTAINSTGTELKTALASRA